MNWLHKFVAKDESINKADVQSKVLPDGNQFVVG